ncbi:hypothetical protein IKW73_02890 [Candidatus Saccharibacteria bacterium]|nr:hypothetical protein [Candidatus Saccharibacteria bacterium]
MSDVYSLLNELSTTGVSTFDAATSWKICTIVIAALGTIALFVFFTYLKKGKEKRNFVEDIKNFCLFKANFAEDLAKIVFYYMSIAKFMNALQTLTTGGDPWGFFGLLFELVFIRFVYETVIAGLRFAKSNTK